MLEIDSLDVYHGRLQVLWGLSLSVGDGECVTVLGPNGAGKTTLVETVMGLNRPARGSIRFDGQELTGLRPNEVVSRGISIVPEKRELFPRMTVAENLALGAYARGGGDRCPGLRTLPGPRRAPGPACRDHVRRRAADARDRSRPRCPPRLLILDEPSLGLSPLFVSTVLESIAALNAEGLTILLLEQNVRSALEVSDRAYVLENGRVVLEGPSKALLDDPKVQASYLGV